MSKKHWSDQMNEEYEAATTDEERLVALQKHMSHDRALTYLHDTESHRAADRLHQDKQVAQFIKDGHLRPASKPNARPDEGREDSEPDTGDDA